MRNFPHQVNRIAKIKGALHIAVQLLSKGMDLGDDGSLGYALARAKVYTFRGLEDASQDQIEGTIWHEQTKAASNQGPRTFARDLRRTLLLLGFIEHTEAGDWRITDAAETLLSLPDPPDHRSTAIWVRALLDLELSDSAGGPASHPAVNMLRILAQLPRIEKRGLAFALSMVDDSEQELNRAAGLGQMDFGEALTATGASAYKAANAVKILPSLLEQLGLVSIQNGICTLTEPGLQAIGGSVVGVRVPETAPRLPRRGFAVPGPEYISRRALVPGQMRTREEQLHATLLLEERTSQHQELLRRIVSKLHQVSDLRCSDDAFDVVAESLIRPEMLLIEAKTLRDDALAQARIALGQVMFYEFFDVEPVAKGKAIRKAVAFDSDPGEQVVAFLTRHGVTTIISGPDNLVVPRELKEYFKGD